MEFNLFSSIPHAHARVGTGLTTKATKGDVLKFVAIEVVYAAMFGLVVTIVFVGLL